MGTYYNNAICDIYIGKGAGRKLLEDISLAKHSVKIISPYFSPFLIRSLTQLHLRGIDIRLITHEDHFKYFRRDYEKDIYKLIRQHKKTDLEAQKTRNKWIKTRNISIGVGVVLGFISILSYMMKNPISDFAFLLMLLSTLVVFIYNKKIKEKQIYHYSYSQLFPFKALLYSDYQQNQYTTFVHSKIYIIDDRIVYMGSLNFTTSGTKHNHETRIRTTDKRAITEILEEFNRLFYFSDLAERDIQIWGKTLYGEPIN